jgi:hypothetical protein
MSETDFLKRTSFSQSELTVKSEQLESEQGPKPERGRRGSRDAGLRARRGAITGATSDLLAARKLGVTP